MARYHDIQGRPSSKSKKKYVLGYLCYGKVEEYDDRRWSNHLMRVPGGCCIPANNKKKKRKKSVNVA